MRTQLFGRRLWRDGLIHQRVALHGNELRGGAVASWTQSGHNQIKYLPDSRLAFVTFAKEYSVLTQLCECLCVYGSMKITFYVSRDLLGCCCCCMCAHENEKAAQRSIINVCFACAAHTALFMFSLTLYVSGLCFMLQLCLLCGPNKSVFSAKQTMVCRRSP